MFCGGVPRSSSFSFFAVVRATVGAVHWSRVVGQEGAVGIRRDDFPAVRMFVG